MFFLFLGSVYSILLDYHPLLCVDDSFFTVKYKCQILTALGVDENNQILPLAFAFVEEGESRLS